MPFPRFAGVLLLLCAPAAVAQISDNFPVAKVIDLLGKLKIEIIKEGRQEESQYQVFACFCKSQTAEQATKISTGKSGIESLSASIAELSAVRGSKQKEKASLQAENERHSKELQDATAAFTQKKSQYMAASAELNKAITSMQQAIKALSDSQQTKAALIDVTQLISHSLDLANSMGLSPKGQKQQAVGLFLQQAGKGKVDPTDPEYKFHSSGIVQILEELLDEFQQRKTDVDTEFTKAQTAYEAEKEGLTKAVQENIEFMKVLDEEIEKLAQKISETRGGILTSEMRIKDDDTYLLDVSKQCEHRATDWDQRSAARKGELEAIQKALELLTSKVSSADMSVNRLRTASLVDSSSFLQESSVVGQKISLRHKARDDPRTERAIALLTEQSRKLGSAVLSSVAMKVAVDPFNSVKQLITDLVARLQGEMHAELSKQGFCDREIQKATHDRDVQHRATTKLSAELGELEVKTEALTQEIADLKDQMNELQATLKHADQMRANEKSENSEATKTANEGLDALKQAIATIKDYYRMNDFRASRHDATYEVQNSRLSSDYSGSALDAGFHGAYHGKQDSAPAIIGMMEVIETDFKNSINEIKSAESKAAAEHVQFTRDTKSDVAGKQTQVKMDEQEKTSAQTSIDDKMSDLKTHSSLLDGALKTLADLKPTCVDTSMSHAERTQKRDEEIAALKKALCTLDPARVESDCQ